jgi:ligand-binding SRPBCC domain-containing protein
MQPKTFDRVINALRTDDGAPPDVQILHAETIVDASIADTFAFFSNAANLERLTPPWLNFKILTPMPIAMREGTVIDYEISLYGVPMPWRTRIDVWEPGIRFVDRQLAGPYRWWRHTHSFESHAGGTRVVDHVEYSPRAATLTNWLVNRDVARIFEHRQRVLGDALADELEQVRRLAAHKARELLINNPGNAPDVVDR